jgi:hypothetical protein
MTDKVFYRGGPLDGQEALSGTTRYVLVPDYEGSILCGTDDGPQRCFPMHRYERKTFAIQFSRLRSEELVYVGKEPAVPCGPIIGGDRTVFASDGAPILNVPKV